MNIKGKTYIVLIVILVMVMLGIHAIKTFVYPLKYKEQIIKYSKANNIDPYLILAIINTESKFNKDAVSNMKAKGLMQITKPTAEEINNMTNSTEQINDDTIYDVDVNLDIGCYYLASLIERYNGNYYLAICAYNAGMGNVNKWIEQDIIPSTLDTTDIKLPFKETTNYLKKVIKAYEMYKKIYML